MMEADPSYEYENQDVLGPIETPAFKQDPVFDYEEDTSVPEDLQTEPSGPDHQLLMEADPQYTYDYQEEPDTSSSITHFDVIEDDTSPVVNPMAQTSNQVNEHNELDIFGDVANYDDPDSEWEAVAEIPPSAPNSARPKPNQAGSHAQNGNQSPRPPQNERESLSEDDLFLLSLQAIQALHPTNVDGDYEPMAWEMRGVCEVLVRENPCGQW